MRADLHTHSVHSDGLTTPTENAALAAAAGLSALALTDHDTLEGWAEAALACAERGVELVPGVELSAEMEGFSVHVLGYWPDPEHPELRAECARLRNERDRRAAVMVDHLRAEGFELTIERVRTIAGSAPLGRPHLAAAMVEAGAVVDFEAAFRDWIGDGGRAYEPKRALDPVAAVRLLRAAGGVPVLAHPGAWGRGEDPGTRSASAASAGTGAVHAGTRSASAGTGAVDHGVPLAVVDAMVEAGLAGIEADTPAHEPPVADRWRIVAHERHLVVTGSSDYHGRPDGSMIGDRWTGPDALAALANQRGLAPGRGQEPAGGSEDK